ncbi:hypothetical protein BDW59DRAFT_149092 [Aspergillus cavernicola]|uniref:Uncharacterized protein n=1 Tax=Aspergillus cavernicola TaxID=176166 RepID=A0ABR4I622_9EURO
MFMTRSTLCNPMFGKRDTISGPGGGCNTQRHKTFSNLQGPRQRSTVFSLVLAAQYLQITAASVKTMVLLLPDLYPYSLALHIVIVYPEVLPEPRTKTLPQNIAQMACFLGRLKFQAPASNLECSTSRIHSRHNLLVWHEADSKGVSASTKAGNVFHPIRRGGTVYPSRKEAVNELSRLDTAEAVAKANEKTTSTRQGARTMKSA